MTGNIEINPKIRVNNADTMYHRPPAFRGRYANSPPNHPGMKISQTNPSIIPIETSVANPNNNHLINGMISLYGIPFSPPMPHCIYLK